MRVKTWKKCAALLLALTLCLALAACGGDGSDGGAVGTFSKVSGDTPGETIGDSYVFRAAPDTAEEMESVYRDIFAGLYLSDGE